VALPLRYRLPNPPPIWEGRAAEATWIAERLADGPLVVVEGEGGIGKTALVLHVLGSMMERDAPALHVDIRPGDQPEDVRIEVARALAASGAAAGVDPASLASEPEALGAIVVDLADAGRFHVVVDDLHNASEESVRDLVDHVERYARAARWVLVTRELPDHVAPAARRLTVGPMPEDDLLRLARAVDAGLDPKAEAAAVRVARAVSGSTSSTTPE